MSSIGTIRSGLEAGIAACESLRTWIETLDGHDLVDWREQQLRAALKALGEVERQQKPCTLPHVAIAYDAPTACYCNAVSNPPCNWCTDGGGDDDEEGQQYTLWMGGCPEHSEAHWQWSCEQCPAGRCAWGSELTANDMRSMAERHVALQHPDAVLAADDRSGQVTA